jgi:hypothetical protein
VSPPFCGFFQTCFCDYVCVDITLHEMNVADNVATHEDFIAGLQVR